MLALFIARVASFDGQCFLCQTAAGIAIELLNKEIEAAKIPEMIKELCVKKVPVYLQDLCVKMATLPLEELVRLLQDKQTPTKACQLIKMCKRVSINKYREPVSNAAPQFKDETQPQWSISWEEQI